MMLADIKYTHSYMYIWLAENCQRSLNKPLEFVETGFLVGRLSFLGQSWKTAGKLGVNKSRECDSFSFSALTLLVA